MPLNGNLLESKSSLVLLILTLDAKEWRKFKDFVYSPFFNKEEKVKTLYELIDKKYPFKRGLYKTDLLPVLENKKNYQQDYILTTKEDGALRKLMMRFSNLLKEFIIYQTTKHHETYRQRKLIDFLMSRKQYSLIPDTIKKQTQKIEKEDAINLQYYYDNFQMAEAEFYMLILKNDQKNVATTQQLINSFIDYSLSVLMTYYSAAFNRETILKLEHQYPLRDAVLAYINDNLNEVNPLARTYFHIFNLIKTGEQEEFKFIKNIMADSPGFDITMQRQVYSHMLNYCSKQIRLGAFQYRQEKHSIYQVALTNKLLSSGLYFSSQHYLLIAKNALKLGHYDWAWTFIHDYRYELNPTYSSQYMLVQAHYYFYTKDYEEALACLVKINYSKDFFSILQYRVLWIQIHYESETISNDAVNNSLEALRQYLSNDTKMSKRIKNSHHNFMKLTKRLLRLKEATSKKETLFTKLKADILQTKNLDERDWLQDKTNELEIES